MWILVRDIFGVEAGTLLRQMFTERARNAVDVRNVWHIVRVGQCVHE